MTGRPLVQIQPKPSAVTTNDEDPDPQQGRTRRSRSAILVACDPCRRLKTKCDGERPACGKCRNRGQDCIYELPQDALSRSSARKEIQNQLQRENLELRQLFHHLSKRPELEAYNIFQRIRASDDPIAVAHTIKQAELLLPPTPSDEHGELTTLNQLEFDALGRSPIKVPARPWTAVAGDGIVSELVSAWFKWDNAFLYPFIDRQCFLQDMRKGDPRTAKYCSPFLVNAICALRSYFSDTVDVVQRITQQNMRENFLDETKKQYDHGLPTLPTIQGLWILFSVYSLKGEDRNGSLYRFASYGMLKRSRVNHVFSSLIGADSETVAKKRAISKTAWGLFCLESVTATNFRNIDVLGPPKIPCLFPEFTYETPINVDLFGEEFTTASPQPPFVGGALNAFCRVVILMSEVLALGRGHKDNEDAGTGEHTKLRERKEALSQLNSLANSLPSALQYNQNFTPETCYLRITMNMVAYAILRPLHPDIILGEDDGTTVKAMLLKHCVLDTELMERYFSVWPTGEFSTMAFMGPLNSGTVLLPLLPDEHVQYLFPRICRLMRTVAARMPIARYVMKGWQAAIWSRKMEIPGPAQPYFQNLGGDREQFEDMPTSLVVAHVPNAEDGLSDQWDDGELGYLLKKWSKMSID
ncbi:putative C6 transcription factor [Xylaria palmicola]|nr:putative C6 transcription factor [Xylaria palmicola]